MLLLTPISGQPWVLLPEAISAISQWCKFLSLYADYKYEECSCRPENGLGKEGHQVLPEQEPIPQGDEGLPEDAL